VEWLDRMSFRSQAARAAERAGCGQERGGQSALQDAVCGLVPPEDLVIDAADGAVPVLQRS
jgi:hypothetical protein